MRPGFDQPTSSSASRSSGTGAREHTQRTRQGRNDAPAQADSISARRKSSNQPTLTLPQQTGDIQPTPSGRKSPAYLEGKNPYGQILDNVDHPYCRPKPTGGAPSQIGATFESRPRTSGSFHFKTRPEPKPEPEREVTAPDPSPPPVPPRTPAKPVSVRAAKDFFESKASQNRSAPPLPPRGAAAAAIGADAKTRNTEKDALSLPRRRSKDQAARPARIPSPTSRIAIRSEMDMEPSMPRPPPDTSSQLDPTQRTNPFTRHKSDGLTPSVVVRKATTPQDSSVYDVQSSSDPPEMRSGRRKSTNIFETAPRDARPLGFERRAIDNSSKLDEASNAPLIAVEHAIRSDDRHTSDETVRRRSHHELVSAAESDEEARTDFSSFRSQTRRVEPGRNVRAAVEAHDGSTTKRLRRRQSRSAPLTDERSSAERPTKSRSRKSSATDREQFSDLSISDAPGTVFTRIADIASNSFSHDGSSSIPSMSRRSTTSGLVPQLETQNRSKDPNVAVPDHVDWRGAYGRRKTKDFGYPGARIKPRGTYRTYKPLQDPDNWTKRACGHFSYMATTESRDEATKKLCRQCATKTTPPEPQSMKQQRTRKRAATDSSSSSSQSSNKADSSSHRSSRRRKHHSECSPADKCSDTFAKDLGYIIDAILEEHTNTLQGVINNIRHSQPRLAQLRRVSEDLVQRCQAGGVCTNPCHTPCRPSCQSCQPCQPVQHVCE